MNLPKMFALIAVGVFALSAVSMWPFTVDDTYITLRVSKHVAEMQGPVWNAGEKDEAYTSPLWMALNVPLHDPLAAKVMGVLFAIGTALLLWLMFKEWYPDVGWIVAGLFLSYPHTAVHAVSGMETSLAAFLVALALYFRYRGWGTRLMPVLAAIVLTRPEMVLFAMPLAIEAVWYSGDKGRMVPTVWVLFLLPLVVWFGMRAIYYGELMPLSFYVKSSAPGALGWPMVLNFLRDNAILMLPLVLMIQDRWRSYTWVIVGVLTAIVYLIVPEHIMGYGYRFFFPLIPALLYLAGRMVRDARPQRLWVVAFLSLIYIGTGIQQLDTYRLQGERLEATHRKLGEALTGNGTIVCGDIGMVGYYGSWKVVDFIGLADRTVAKGGGTPEYFLSKQPDLIVAIIHNGVTLGGEIVEAAEKAGYRRIGALQYASNYYLLIVAKPDSPNADRALKNLLGDRYAPSS